MAEPVHAPRPALPAAAPGPERVPLVADFPGCRPAPVAAEDVARTRTAESSTGRRARRPQWCFVSPRVRTNGEPARRLTSLAVLIGASRRSGSCSGGFGSWYS